MDPVWVLLLVLKDVEFAYNSNRKKQCTKRNDWRIIKDIRRWIISTKVIVQMPINILEDSLELEILLEILEWIIMLE
jgi:hypothetical protein